jgi:raffinose synthase
MVAIGKICVNGVKSGGAWFDLRQDAGGAANGFQAGARMTQLSETVSLCTASAVCPEGLNGQDALHICVDMPGDGRYLAIESQSDYWCRPFFGGDPRQIPRMTQALLLEKDGIYRYYLPLCGGLAKAVLRGGAEGMEAVLILNVDTITALEDEPVFLFAQGPEPMPLIRACAQSASQALGKPVKLRGERKLAPVFDFLGWCSWDAMQIRVNHQGLLEKAAELRQKGVPVRFAIIDDMWAHVPGLNDVPKTVSFHEMVQIMHASKLYDFQGDPQRFAQGMAAAIADLKAAGIQHVGLWFPTTGYWSGLDGDGPAAQMLGESVMQAPNGQTLVCPKRETAQRYFDALCGQAKRFGADFVKIDNQGFHKRYAGVAPVGETAASVHQAIDQSAQRFFDGALINCMGMPNECMFNRPQSAVSRCSDDFIPQDRAWFVKNVLQCAYNGLLQGQYYVNDWDMWWTDDAQAVKNSVCRAVSGGPIYISDPIGRTRPEVLAPLVYLDGRVLRCDKSAVPAADCLTQDPTRSGRPFKIVNRVGGAGVVAAFHIGQTQTPVFGSVSPQDAGLPSGQYGWQEYFSGEQGVLQAGQTIPLSLADADQFRLYRFVPLENGAAALGRMDKMISMAAVLAFDAQGAVLYEGGEFGFWYENEVRVFAGEQELQQVRSGNFVRVKMRPEQCRLRFVPV